MNYQRDGAEDAPEFIDTRQAPEAIDAMKPSQYPQPELHQQPGVYDYGNHTPNWAPQYPHADEKISKSSPRRIAGLPVWGFWLLISVIGLVVIGASVGGAMGGSQSAKDHSSGQATTTLTAQPQSTSNSASSASADASSGSGTSASSAAQQTADTVYTPATRDCPGSNGETYTPYAADGGTGQYTFVKNCNKNSPATWDITEAFVQTFELCIDMCSSWNYYEYLSDDHPNAQKCVAAVFLAGGAPPGNCWIKNSSLTTNSLVQSTTADIAVLDNI